MNQRENENRYEDCRERIRKAAEQLAIEILDPVIMEDMWMVLAPTTHYVLKGNGEFMLKDSSSKESIENLEKDIAILEEWVRKTCDEEIENSKDCSSRIYKAWKKYSEAFSFEEARKLTYSIGDKFVLDVYGGYRAKNNKDRCAENLKKDVEKLEKFVEEEIKKKNR